MTEDPNSAAPHHLPFFITAPEQTDVLLVAMLILLLAAILFIGNLYFQLHSLPERMAHRVNHMQMQVVAVLCLLALFTHNHVFWIAALLLALLEFPDFSTPINSISQSLEKLSSGDEPSLLPPPARARPPHDGPSLNSAHDANAEVSSPSGKPSVSVVGHVRETPLKGKA
jgi:multisubunit Na+/H+ antiporter MnhF subunit